MLQFRVLGKNLFQVFQGVGNGLQEMGFALKLSSVAVRAEDLQRAQEDEMRECGAPSGFEERFADRTQTALLTEYRK